MARDIKFAENLALQMKLHGISQHKLSEIVNISSPSLSSYKKNALPGLRGAIDIAEYFGVSLDSLVFGNEKTARTSFDMDEKLAQLSQRLEERVERQTRLLSRISTVIEDKMLDVAKAVSDETLKISSKMLLEDEMWKIEKCATKIHIFSANINSEVHYDEGTNAYTPGPYYTAVIKNLLDNPDVQYRYIYSTDVVVPEDCDEQFLRLLEFDVGNLKNRVQIKTLDLHIPSSCVVYELSVARLREKHPSIYQQIIEYITEDNLFGCVLPPSRTPQVNFIMDVEYVNRTLSRFNKLWSKRARVLKKTP